MKSKRLASVLPAPSFNAGSPRAFVSVEGYRRARNQPQHDVAADGRFVMIREAPGTTGALYVEHWVVELLAKVKR